MHAMLNGAAMAVTAANLLMRRNKPHHAGGSLALSALAAVGVMVSGWFGGRLVYEQGMRVRGASPVQYAFVRAGISPGSSWRCSPTTVSQGTLN